MSVYVDSSGVKKSFLNHSNKPVWFGYVNDKGGHVEMNENFVICYMIVLLIIIIATKK